MFRTRAAVPALAGVLAASLALARSPDPAAPTSSSLPGTYVVDWYGGGDFTDLQTALDTVPPDSTVVVQGNWSGPIWVRKAVTVVGLHVSGFWSEDPTPRDFAIEVDAGADARVTFFGLDMELGYADTINGINGIHVQSAGDMVISDSTITGGMVGTSVGDVYRRDGDAVVAGGAKSLYVIRSTIKGGGPGTLVFECGGWSGLQGPHGGDAVQSNDPLVVVDSVVKGGDGGWMIVDCADCDGLVATPGEAGNGIVAAHAYLSNSTVTGGAPGHGWLDLCEPWPGTLGDPGIDVVGTRIDLPDALHGNDAVMGQPLHVKGDGYAPDELVLLFFSTSIGPAIPLKQGPWLLEWPFILVGVVPTDDAGSFALDGTVPNDPQIEGKSLVLQAFAASRVSEPVVYVPWQRHY